MENQTNVLIEKKEKPNSFEYGKAGARFKLYFDTPDELKQLMKELDDITVEIVTTTKND